MLFCCDENKENTVEKSDCGTETKEEPQLNPLQGSKGCQLNEDPLGEP